MAGRILKPSLTSGYPFVVLYRGGPKQVCIHDLVAMAFIGPKPPGFVVNHKNLNKTDNRSCNLEYVTHHENVLHGWENGATERGENHHLAVLTDDQVREIRRRYATEKVTQAALGDEFGVEQALVSMIVHRKRWAHVEGEYDTPKRYERPDRQLCPTDVLEIRERIQAPGVLQKDLAKEYRVSRVTISDVVNRRTWRDLP